VIKNESVRSHSRFPSIVRKVSQAENKTRPIAVSAVQTESIQKLVNELPMPAFYIHTEFQAIHGNAALDDWLAGADPANLYADARTSQTLTTLFPKLADMARFALQNNEPCRETFKWPRQQQQLVGELCLLPFSSADPGLAIGFIRERDGHPRLTRELEARMAFVHMLSDISARAITVEDLPAFLDECMWIIGTTTKVGGVFLWEYNAVGNTFSNICEWMQNGISSYKDQLQELPGDSVPELLVALQNHQIMNIADVREIEAPTFREIVDMLGIQSLLIIPLYIKTRLFGFIGFEEYTRQRTWTDEDVGILKAIAEILTRAIENTQVEHELAAYRASLEARVERRTAELEILNSKLVREIEARRSIAEDLAEKSRSLEEANTALRVVLNQVQSERREVEKIAYQNLEELIGPKVAMLRSSGLNKKQQALLDLIENNVKCLFNPETCTVSDQMRCLTPNELNVADMIRQGRTSKEIAGLLSISIRTVEVYRYNIRRKLGLTNSKANLRTHLLGDLNSW
jgi:DNA-binding CsgD family transcriptional regulator/GAF domain-containing protein